jgi:hypothetical protein
MFFKGLNGKAVKSKFAIFLKNKTERERTYANENQSKS